MGTVHLYYLRHWLAAIGLALFAAFVAFAALGATAAEPKRVLLLHSFGQDFAPFGDFAATFRTELAKGWRGPVDLYEVPLLAARSSTPPEDAPFVDYLLGLFPKHQPDVVVAIGGPAVRFAQRQRQRLFPQAPMLFASSQRHVQDAALTAYDTVVAIDVDLPGYVENIFRVLPQTTDVAVVLGASPLEKFWAAELRREFQPFTNRINFVWFDQHSFEQTKRLAATLPPRSAILYVFMLVDGAGVPYTQEHALRDLHAVANAPIFGIYGEQVGLGTVGGRLLSSQEHGRNTADVAIRILRGETPGRALQPAPLGLGTPVYDSRELRRWGISEASLPAGSSVRFREPTVWQQYGSYIVAGATIFVLQSALIVTLFWQRARRRRAEQEAVSLSGRLLTVHENERRRLARELHDDVTQRLAALAIDAARIDSITRSSTEGGTTRSIRDGLVKLSEDVHALSYRLHPSVIDDLGLVEALKAECDRVARAGSLSVDVNAREIPPKLPQDTALCLFRIAQEALRNVVRHAGASAVEVSLGRMEGGLQLAVSDNGAGFDATRDTARRSLGHASMRERVHLLGGEVDIESTPGQGTTVIAWVPLQVVAS
ncbi:MAG: sensor histidine kinase [Burkholderiales bacterium]